MDILLSLNETRVLGALIEKEITTPDQYPLSLNSLTSACNQKSNREPVFTLEESEIQQVVDELKKRHLITEASGVGSRVSKIQHRFCNTEFGKLKLSEQALGIICVLFLRGPQTPGELRSRTNRLCQFNDVTEVDLCLKELSTRSDGPFVQKMEREPGKREARFMHLLSSSIERSTDSHQIADQSSSIGSSTPPTSLPTPNAASTDSRESDRFDALEALVYELKAEISSMKEQLGDLLE